MRAKPIKWQAGVVFNAVMRKRGQALALIVLQAADTWIAGAVESGGTTLDAVLEQHAHKFIGQFPTLTDAQAAALDFARSWLEAKSKQKLCACKEIIV